MPIDRQDAREKIRRYKSAYEGFLPNNDATHFMHGLEQALDELDAKDKKGEAMRPFWEELNRQGIIT